LTKFFDRHCLNKYRLQTAQQYNTMHAHTEQYQTTSHYKQQSNCTVNH